MCRDCYCGPRRHYGPHEHYGYGPCLGYHLPLMDVDEEIKMIEEYKDTLTKRLEKANKRIDALKR